MSGEDGAVRASEEALRVLDARGLDRVVRRMARSLHGRIMEPFALVGIRRRGVPLAERLARHLRDLGRDVPVGEIRLKRYDDDLRLLHDEPTADDASLPFEPGDVRSVLVDDVVFTGTTLFTAVAHLRARGARAVEAAVVCARDEPDLPVRTATVGLRLDVGPDLIVEVQMPPYDDDEAVRLRPKP